MERVSVICTKRSLAVAGLIGAKRVHSPSGRSSSLKGAAMYPVLTSLLAASNSTGLDVEPSQTGDLPGEQTLETLASGVGHWALLAAIVGIIVGGVMWAFGHFTHNYQQSYSGRRGVIVSGVAALLIGGASQIISFFFSAGVNLH
jgi:type IV secretory pathway VirB2 component (pilin)